MLEDIPLFQVKRAENDITLTRKTLFDLEVIDDQYPYEWSPPVHGLLFCNDSRPGSGSVIDRASAMTATTANTTRTAFSLRQSIGRPAQRTGDWMPLDNQNRARR